MKKGDVRFQFSGDGDPTAIVDVRGALLRAPKSWDGFLTIGTIDPNGKVDPWLVDRVAPRRETVERVQAKADEILYSGELRALYEIARGEYRAEEQRTGSFVVRIGREIYRWHTAPRAQAHTRARLAGEAPGTRAEFFRALPSGTEPFQALEVNEHGHAYFVSLRKEGSSAA